MPFNDPSNPLAAPSLRVRTVADILREQRIAGQDAAQAQVEQAKQSARASGLYSF